MEDQKNNFLSISNEKIFDENLSILFLKGNLDVHTAQSLENEFQNLISQGFYRFVVNLRELDYISSAGLGVFMAFVEEIRNKSGDIKFAEARSSIFIIFDLHGFPLFSIL